MNAWYVFHNGIHFSVNALDTICSSEKLEGDLEVACAALSNFLKCSGFIFILLTIKLIIDTFANDAPNFISDTYKKSVADQVSLSHGRNLLLFELLCDVYCIHFLNFSLRKL